MTHHGLATVDRARASTLPETPPKLIGPAVTVETAHAHADWADGLSTINQEPDTLRGTIDAYRGAGGRGDLPMAADFDARSADVEPERLRAAVVIGSDVGRLTERLTALIDLGFGQVYLHHVGQQLDPFMDVFGEHVLPQLEGVDPVGAGA